MTHLTIAASLLQLCEACHGERSIPGVRLLDVPVLARFECPPCVGVAGRPVEIRYLAWREDIPRDAA